MMMEKPPLVLVKTWYELLTKAEEKEAREHAERMLMGAFGSQQKILDYLKEQNIIS